MTYYRHVMSCLCVYILFIFGLGLLSTHVQAQNKRDFLLGVVTQCLDVKKQNYCSSCALPQSTASCAGHDTCQTNLEIWKISPDFVAMRDRKMCTCPADFVHGLVLPTAPVRGVEDPNRPEAVWQFAWDVGKTKIDPAHMALVVNPRLHRDQDQLHVHMVEVLPQVRDKLTNLTYVHVATLDHVWQEAQNLADKNSFKDYGVLIIAHRQNGFYIIIDQDSPEHKYTKAKCS